MSRNFYWAIVRKTGSLYNQQNNSDFLPTRTTDFVIFKRKMDAEMYINFCDLSGVGIERIEIVRNFKK